MTVPLDNRRVVRMLLLGAGLLFLGHAFVKVAEFGFGHGRLLGLNEMLDLNREGNLAAWFSWSLLMATACLLAAAALMETRSSRVSRRAWWVLAAIFAFLSLDEAASLHERLDSLREPLAASGLLYFPWVIVGGGVALIVFTTHVPFLLSLSTPVRRRILIGGGLFVFGAVGLELFQGLAWESAGRETAMVALLVGIEELLEMTGVIICIDGVLRHLRSRGPVVEVEAVA